MAPRRWGSADDELAEEGSRRFRTAGGRNESEGGEEGAAAAEEEEEDVLEGVDLYAVLNVPRDASEEEIQRAYRALAKTFHPDKHQDKTLQEAAAQSFTRLNEAYTILSNPEQRQVYDIYGMEGLKSGLEVGTKLKSREELRQQWQQFKAKKKREELEQSVNYNGLCVLSVNAEDLPHGRAPHLTSANMLSSVQAPLSRKDVLSLGGHIVAQPLVGGGGSFIMGYQRDCSASSSVSLHAETGLRSVLQLTSTRQLSQRSSASLSATWTPQSGVGLEVSHHRQLFDNVVGDLALVVGPPGGEGVALSLRRQGSKTDVNGTLHVGAQTGITGAVVHTLSSKSALRAGVKLGTMGLELDLGGSRRISYGSTGMSVTIGIQGIILKLRLSRGGQKFVCPIMLFTHYDWRVALASALLPPLCVSGVKYAIIKPILRHLRDKEKLARRSELMGIVSEGLASAESERRLLEPVAKRKTKKEAERGGLVVVSAVYGTRKGLEIWQAQWAQQQRQGSDAAETPAETLQQWCDVTVATQFLVDGSRLVLHQGVSKAGLMGFHDVAPGENKELWVMYLLDGEPFRSQVGDQQSCRLPRDGAAIEDGAQRGEVMRAAELLGLAPHRAAPA